MVPGPTDAYRLRLEGRFVYLPARIPLKLEDLGELTRFERTEVRADTLEVPEEALRLQRELRLRLGLVALVGAVLGALALSRMDGPVPAGLPVFPVRWLPAWLASCVPLLLQPVLAPLSELAPGTLARGPVIRVVASREDALLLLVADGRVAARLARENRVTPVPVGGTGGDLERTFRPGGGPGARLVVLFGVLSALGALALAR